MARLSEVSKLQRNGIVIAVLVTVLVIVQLNRGAPPIDEEEGSNGDNVLDAIFVLMGGMTDDLGVPLWVSRRLDRAAELQKERRTKEGGSPPIVSVGMYTPSKKPNYTAEGFAWYESNAAVDYLHNFHNVSFQLQMKEATSVDTLGNGYFSLVQFAMPEGWRHIAIITSEFHMARSEAIFEWIYGLPGAGALIDHVPATKDKGWQGSKAQGFFLEYHKASDQGLPEGPLAIREGNEKRMVEDMIKPLSKRIITLPQLHDYVYLEDRLYHAAGALEFGHDSLNIKEAALY